MNRPGKINKYPSSANQHPNRDIATGGDAASADYELSRALQKSPGERKERLVNIAHKYPFHVPTWIALANEHQNGGRLEEARYALSKALRLAPDMERRLPLRLRELRSQYGLPAPVAPVSTPAAKPRPTPPTPPAPPARSEARAAHGPRANAEQALAEAFRGDPGTRKERLVRLSKRYPNHAPLWLALAEEHIVARRVEDALYAYNKALTRDPTLADFASPGLAKAWKFHRASSPVPHTAPSAQPPRQPDAERDQSDSQTGRSAAEPHDQPTVMAEPPAGNGAASAQAQLDPVKKQLDEALDQPNRYQKVLMLRRLFRRHRDHSGVLFHFAIESALAGNEADARYAAFLLEQADPDRHALLLEVARGHWPDSRETSMRYGEVDIKKLTGAFLAQNASNEQTVVVDQSALQPRWIGSASSATVIAHAHQEPRNLLCDNCWTVFRNDGTSCPAPSCHRARPRSGWQSLPYRFRDKFVFMEQIGRGATSAVFRSRDSQNQHRESAVKVLRQDHDGSSARARHMFEQEVRAAGLLGQQRNFVNVSAFDVSDSQPFLEMEMVRWPTLSALHRQGGQLSPYQVARLGASILHGLSFMHAHNMVHCDLRPEHIFIHYLDGKCTTKIAGLGRWLYDSRAQERHLLIEELPSNMDYLSPEQTRVGPLTTASDIHAVGSILWQALVGWVPFPVSGVTSNDRLLFRYECSRRPPECPMGMPHALYSILVAALAHDPGVRPSAAHLRHELDGLALQLAGSGSGFDRHEHRIDDLLRRIQQRKATYGLRSSAGAQLLRLEHMLMDVRTSYGRKALDAAAVDTRTQDIHDQLARLDAHMAGARPRAMIAARKPALVIDERRNFLQSNGFLLICLFIALLLFVIAIVLSAT